MTTEARCHCGDTNCQIPYEFCHCGACGQLTAISKKDRPESGYMKGQPAFYVRGHDNSARKKRLAIEQPNDTTIRHIPLTRGLHVSVSICDYDRFIPHNWNAIKPSGSDTFYAARGRRKHEPPGSEVILMHDEIVQPRPGYVADHIDGCGMNNTRENLREALHIENLRNTKLYSSNTSGCKGVDWCKRGQVWRVRITVNGIDICLGRFKDEDFNKAVEAREAAEIKYFGEFRRDIKYRKK